MNDLTLEKLTQAYGVSGSENNIVDILKEYLLTIGDTYVDSLNNVYCTFGEGYHFLLDAHIDEIGFVVTDITDDGFIKFNNLGGIDKRFLPAAEVEILGRKKIYGVISTLPPHLQSSKDENEAADISKLSIDTGYTKNELANIVSLGDKIVMKKQYTQLLNSQISASNLDDRAGVFAILNAIEELKKINCKITIVFTSQEEVGTRGAKVISYNKDIDEAISVDVSFAYTNECSRDDCGELGKGVMIGFSPILNSDMSRLMVNAAEKNDIPFQYEVMGSRTGTNADVISISGSGIKTALLSIPEKYMHQSVETVDIQDVNSVTRLIVAYIKERIGEINA